MIYLHCLLFNLLNFQSLRFNLLLEPFILFLNKYDSSLKLLEEPLICLLQSNYTSLVFSSRSAKSLLQLFTLYLELPRILLNCHHLCMRICHPVFEQRNLLLQVSNSLANYNHFLQSMVSSFNELTFLFLASNQSMI
ncbi:hypothetical protein GOP47_0007729 [Adiantum capillus-veneris]|uniref:Uncharacterized protein n=1 Tax=Adiantum capillus-veneris TaxID=13818 RepID=A0A9D4ZM88_ADICA|nr:hypothetical protein GOP47_0007729 [Adiantum capillus-veneris]